MEPTRHASTSGSVADTFATRLNIAQVNTVVYKNSEQSNESFQNIDEQYHSAAVAAKSYCSTKQRRCKVVRELVGRAEAPNY